MGPSGREVPTMVARRVFGVYAQAILSRGCCCDMGPVVYNFDAVPGSWEV